MEPSTAERLEVEVMVNGQAYLWNPVDGLDPNVVAGVDRYIWRMANRLAPLGRSLGHEPADLYQAGVLGALMAARNFDAHRGTQYLTWAHWRILSEMQQLLASRPLQVPPSRRHEVSWLVSLSATCGFEQTLDQRLHDPASDEPPPVQDDYWLSRGWPRLALRERLVLQARYGLFGNPAETLEEVGQRLKVTRERVRQIEADAIRKLRRFLREVTC